MSLGIGVEYVADALRHTPTLIAEVNRQMPRTRGACRLPLSAFAAMIETDRPLREAPVREPDAADRAIGARVAALIEDGDTLQIGVGALPDAVLGALTGHADLGFHTGMITDGVLGLIERGVATGAKKEIDRGLVITGAALGSAALYGRLHQFPVEFRPASYTHNPVVLSRLRSLVSVNSAIEVDLLGQVGRGTAGRSAHRRGRRPGRLQPRGLADRRPVGHRAALRIMAAGSRAAGPRSPRSCVAPW